MDGEKFTIVQLRAVLKRLSLSMKGNKAEIMKRLQMHDPSGSWRELVGTSEEEEEQTDDSQSPGGEGNSDRPETEQRSTLPTRDARRQEMAAEESAVIDCDLELRRRERELTWEI